MSKRYGRNQKRKHRDKIRELEIRIRRETFAYVHIGNLNLVDAEKLKIKTSFLSAVILITF